MKQTLLYLLISFSVSAQVKGVVLDSISGKPIAYVNIWVENENIGTTSEENGTFLLDLKEGKRIVFSALGYETKTLKSTEIEKVKLYPKVYELEEVVLEIPKKTKELEVGDSKKMNHTYFSGDKPWIYVKLFDFEELYSKTPFLKKIHFYSDSKIKNAKIKIRVFEMNDSLPNFDLLFEDIIVTVKKGMRKNTVDVSKYNIKFPSKGLLIGLEWLIIDENRREYMYKDKENKIKKAITYEPSLVVNYSETENTFRFSGGKWSRNKKYKLDNGLAWDNKILAPAINITLTN
jgi:hypothetical protein